MATSLEEAAKYALLSFDATMRSNVTVGPPIDLLIYRKNTFEMTRHRRLAALDQDLNVIQRRGSSRCGARSSSCRRFSSTSRIARSMRPARGGRGPADDRPELISAVRARPADPWLSSPPTRSPATRVDGVFDEMLDARSQPRRVVPAPAPRAAEAHARGTVAQQAAGGPVLLQPGHHLHRLRPARKGPSGSSRTTCCRGSSPRPTGK